MKYKFQTLFDGQESTTTGGCAGVAGYSRLGFQLKAANISSGNCVYRFQGTVDGTNWTFLNLIDNLSNSNGQTLTRVASKTLSANGTALLWLDESLPLRAVRLSLTRTTDGSYSAYLMAAE